MKLREHELPRTREEVTAWALAFSDGFSWQNLADEDMSTIVTGTNIILRWLCNDLAVSCPDLISLNFELNHYGTMGTRIRVARIAVAGGMIPSKGLIMHVVRNRIPIQIRNHTEYKCTNELDRDNYLDPLGLR